ncbi:MAG: protein-L-isoaspartate(D-aspartate) O-methyltransferase [Candidatus Bathyarchaeota archaeon]|nr:protein-L-isoaspartate(D-aspartate) O-methyltransferase [Candidatus Bathyarchaeota archaeon]
MQRSDWDKLIDNLKWQGILKTEKTIKALCNVPRARFLPQDKQEYAAADVPLPLGFGQTISAPHMVSIMNEALNLAVGHKVLEVGAGSGWHAATIAELIAPRDVPRSEWGHIYTVEIVQSLAEQARKSILNAGYGDRVTIVNADGSKGYSEKAPFDRIVVTAAAPEVPPPLLDQLKSGGTMVIPVGKAALFQSLMRLTKDFDDNVSQENLGGVAFVPLTGKFGQSF